MYEWVRTDEGKVKHTGWSLSLIVHVCTTFLESHSLQIKKNLKGDDSDKR